MSEARGEPVPTGRTPSGGGRELGKARPRDELGRPLPWGVPNRLQAVDAAETESLDTEALHERALVEFTKGRFFQAHELWEVCWKRERPSRRGEVFRGLSQIAAGCVHLARGNPRGAAALLQRGASRLASWGGEVLGEEGQGASWRPASTSSSS